MANDVELQNVGVYGGTTYTARHSLWSTLVNLYDCWCILGDFNVFLCVEIVKDDVSPSSISCAKFSNWINSNKLF